MILLHNFLTKHVFRRDQEAKLTYFINFLHCHICKSRTNGLLSLRTEGNCWSGYFQSFSATALSVILFYLLVHISQATPPITIYHFITSYHDQSLPSPPIIIHHLITTHHYQSLHHHPSAHSHHLINMHHCYQHLSPTTTHHLSSRVITPHPRPPDKPAARHISRYQD